jgi:hypothetical protein
MKNDSRKNIYKRNIEDKENKGNLKNKDKINKLYGENNKRKEQERNK